MPQEWQEYDFGGDTNEEPVDLQARNRLEILDAGSGSLAIFPPPHKFFFARENEVNLGYVYYRKDSDNEFSLGVMQPEHGEGYAPWGVTDEVWDHRRARCTLANLQLRALQRPSRHHAAHGCLLLLERRGAPARRSSR